ncbi:MAG: hypothetical protein ACK40G_10040 [Cytophagaceae bacterium]
MVYKVKRFFEALENVLYNFYEVIKSLVKLLVLSRFYIKVPKATRDVCFVIGNGPSFKSVLQSNLELLKSSELFCVNNFPSSDEYELLKPGNCVLLDPGYYPQDISKMNPVLSKTIHDIVSKTNWKLNLFIPVLASKAKHLTSLPSKNRNVTVYFYNYTIIKGFKFFRNFLFSRNLGMPQCQNVLGATIFLAVNSGYKKVYLIGADHTIGKNIFVNENNELCMIHEHFYSDGKKTITPAYNPNVSKKRLNIAEFYQLCVKTFTTYYILEEYAKGKNAKIYNLSEGSYIDAFERKNINDLKIG